jgi:hypothetical protein
MTLWSKNEGIVVVPRVGSKQVFFEYTVVFYNCEGLCFANDDFLAPVNLEMQLTSV